MRVEESQNAAARVLGRRFMITDAYHLRHFEKQVVVVVHEGMPGVGIFLHIVRNVNGGQHPSQFGRGAPCEAIFGPIARDDRTCTSQQGFGILGIRPP